MATGDKKCFNLTIVDDDQLEPTTESYYFAFDALNSSIRNNLFFGPINIYIRDNEGQFSNHINLVLRLFNTINS